MKEEHALTWEIYLKYLQAQAKRAALQKARLANSDTPHPQRGSIDGQGTVQLEYLTFCDQPPWNVADLARFEKLVNGGEWDDDEPDALPEAV